MRDDASPSVEQLQAELAELRRLHAAEVAALREELDNRTSERDAALEQQTATSDILRVIASSPTDLYLVLDAIIDAAVRLCDADTGVLLRARDSDDSLVAYAIAGQQHERAPRLFYEDRATYITTTTAGVPATRQSIGGRAFVEQRAINVIDMAEAAQVEYPAARPAQQRHGHRSALSVPLMRRGESIGVLNLRRTYVRP